MHAAIRKPDSSGITDAKRALIEPLIPIPGLGRSRINDLRETVKAILHPNHSECQREMGPHNLLRRPADLPAKRTVQDDFPHWCDGRIRQRIMNALRDGLRTGPVEVDLTISTGATTAPPRRIDGASLSGLG